MNLYRWIAVLALTGIACPAFADEYCSPSDPNCNDCTNRENTRKWFEEDRKKGEAEETKRMEADVESQRQRDEEFERQSAPGRAERARQ